MVLLVEIIISDESSPYDPYLVVRARVEKNRIRIIINKRHSYWNELTTEESAFSFLKNCIYDGVAEWKVFYFKGTINPDTIKLIKDYLLRINLTFEN